MVRDCTFDEDIRLLEGVGVSVLRKMQNDRKRQNKVEKDIGETP